MNGLNLRAIRQAMRLSQRQLGQAVGKSQSYIASLERGVRPTSTAHIAQLADALSVEPLALSASIAVDVNGKVHILEAGQ